MKQERARQLSGKPMKPMVAAECYVAFCSALGMPYLPNTPRLAREVGKQMSDIQAGNLKAVKPLLAENEKLRRQINYFSGRSFWQRLVGVFVRPRYQLIEDKGICPQCQDHETPGCHIQGRGVAAVVKDCIAFKANQNSSF